MAGKYWVASEKQYAIVGPFMQDYSSSGAPQKPHTRSFGFIYIIPIGLTLGFFLFALAFILKGNSITLPQLATTVTPTVTSSPQLTPLPTSTPQPTPEPTVAETVAKESGTILVENGSGTAGAAGKVAKVLKDDGFSRVTTGNANDFSFKNITIQYKKEAKQLASLVEKTLQASYPIEEVTEADTDQQADILVIVGKVEADEGQ